jgi:hypothetical protein
MSDSPGPLPEGRASDEERDKEYQRYLDERKELIDAARESARTFDKAVLAFGSAVFGFSIAFLKDVAPHPARDTLGWLGAAWVLFAFSLLIILLSFIFSHRACMFEIACATKKITDPDSETKKNWSSVVTDWCNFTCIALLFFGLISWSVFAFRNLGQEGNTSVNKVETPTEKKGYVPASTPAKAPVRQHTPNAPQPPVEKK